MHDGSTQDKPARREAKFAAAAVRAIAGVTRAGAIRYDRAHHLPRLIRATPDELVDRGAAGTRRLLARLSRAIEAERRRGRARHWSYDLGRHIALRQALAAERLRLRRELAEDARPVDAGPPHGTDRR